MSIEYKRYRIIGRNTPRQLLKDGELGTIGAAMIRTGIYEIQLKGDCHVSLLTDADTFNKIENDTVLIVESNGFWNRLTDKNVTVKRSNGEIIKGIKTF